MHRVLADVAPAPSTGIAPIAVICVLVALVVIAAVVVLIVVLRRRKK